MTARGQPPADALPIDGALPDVLAAVRAARRLVLEAEPGAGKTTRVPWALAEAGLAGDGRVLVLEPRRLAARAAAAYVARSLGESAGERVGYEVRFESAVGPRTRVVYLTEGLFVRRVRSDPGLRGVGAVVLDEFHERHVASDLALGLALLAQARRGPAEPLSLVVMSATLDGERLARFLDAPHRRVPGRTHPVRVEHEPPGERAAPHASRAGGVRGGAPPGSALALAERTARAVRAVLREEREGHVLVFLPGVREIRATESALAPFAEETGVRLLPLHGELDLAAQERALAPSRERKVVLATNVAETSLTLDGVTTVVDTGLARVPGHDPWSGLPRLDLARVSRASAAQRAGRAGRQRPGRCLRLYTQADHDARPAHEAPEVARLDLAEALLDLHAAGVADPRAFPWLDPPPEPALRAAERLLVVLGAVEERAGAGSATGRSGELTETGRAMLRFPAHPRVARFLVEAERLGVARDAAGVAALLGERGIRRTPPPPRSGTADVLLDLHELDAAGGDAHAARRRGLDPQACRLVERARRQLAALLRRDAAPPPADPDEADARLRRALLAAWPDRVARLRGAPGERSAVFAGGGSALVARESAAQAAEWAVVLDAEERREPGARGAVVRARSVAAIEPEWLLALDPPQVEERVRVAFDPARERVEARGELRFGELVLDDAPLRTLPPEATERLREAALAAGPGAFARDAEALRTLLARSRFAHGHDARVPALSDDDVRDVLAALCEGRSSFAELRAAGLDDEVAARLGPDGAARLERLAPREVPLPGRRRVPVHYEDGKPPWIASRLQDFLGAAEGPRIAGGRVPLVLHLLAPNQRAVQITTDLAGFWRQHYPELRKQLMRRYPRHAWPERPEAAAPERGGRSG